MDGGVGRRMMTGSLASSAATASRSRPRTTPHRPPKSVRTALPVSSCGEWECPVGDGLSSELHRVSSQMAPVMSAPKGSRS